jgi:hypothetical protein
MKWTNRGGARVMGAVWFRYRAEFGGRVRAWLVLAALAGLVGGVVLAALSGARRTDDAYPRFLASQHAYDVIVVSGRGEFFPFAEFDLGEIAALPAVSESSRLGVPQFFSEAPNGKVINGDNLTPLVPLDGGFGDTFNRLHMVKGQSPQQPDEIAPSLVAAEVFGLDVGDILEARFLPEEVVESWFAGDLSADFSEEELPATPLRVSGIAAAPGEFPPIELTAGNDPFVHLAPSFARSPSYYAPIEALAVRVRGGSAGVPSFITELERRAEGRPLFTIEQAAASAATQRSIGVQADALRVLAVVAGIAGFLVVGQLLARQSRLDGADDPELRAMGMSPRQLVGAAGLRAATIAVVAAAVAIGFAVALSPLSPIGLARDAETDLGINVDAFVVGVGAVCVLAAVALVSVLAAWRVVRQGASSKRTLDSVRRPVVADRMARAGVPATAVHGVRLALEPGRSATAAPARQTVLVVSLAVVTIVAVATFSSNLRHLLDTPQLYGWNWDAMMGDQFISGEVGRDVAADLAADDRIDGLAVGALLGVRIGDEQLDVLATEPVKGGLGPVIGEGDAPVNDDEIALGRRTLDDLDVGIGDEVVVHFADRSASMRIVGQVVAPGIGAAGGLGRGAAMSLGGARQLAPRAAVNIVLVDVAQPADVPAVVQQLNTYQDYEDTIAVARQPTDLSDLARIGSAPFVIGTAMVIVALAAIVHGLVTSVRRHRRDLAILKTLGLRSRQVVRVVLWQATTIALIALAIGIPVGIIAGNVAWRTFSNQVGVVPDTTISIALVGALIPIVLITASLAAALPGQIAARIRPALVLRSE